LFRFIKEFVIKMTSEFSKNIARQTKLKAQEAAKSLQPIKEEVPAHED
jgi:hypothetical protein